MVKYSLHIGGDETPIRGLILQRLIIEAWIESDGRAISQNEAMAEVGLDGFPGYTLSIAALSEQYCSTTIACPRP